jgi:subtilisin-like proprotein convertase family protein
MGNRTRWTNLTLATAALALLGAGSALAARTGGQAADLAPTREAVARPAGSDLVGTARPHSDRGAKVPLRVFPHVIDGTTVLYDNGPFVTHPGGGGGGADASRLQTTSLGMNTLGFGASTATAFRLADDFAVTDPFGWDVDTITVYCYQTGSPTTSTLNNARLQIWDGDPGAGGTVIFGDTTTNRLLSTAWTNAYRDTETTVGNTTRPIMEAVIDVGGFHLDPGTYWIDYQVGGTLASGPFCPPITVTGQAVTGNAQQFNGTVWGPANDTGTGTPQQGMPFVVEGTVPAPEISLAKTVGTDLNPMNCGTDETLSVPAGTVVQYCYTVTNTGTITLEYHTLVDDQLGVLIQDLPFTLNAGASAFLTVQTPITATVTNNATWSARVDPPSTVGTVTVDLNGVSHTWPDDIDILLVSPTGESLVLMSDVGGSTDIVSIALTVDDAAATLFPDGTVIAPGSYRPTNVGLLATEFPAPAPAGPWGQPAPAGTDTLTSIFGGIGVTGTWSLYVADGFNADAGTITEWCVHVQPAGLTACNNAGITIGPNAGAGVPYPSTVDLADTPDATASDSVTVTALFPDAAVDPTSLSSTLLSGESDSQVLTIENNGQAPLDWDLYEGPGVVTAPVGGPVYYTDRATFEADNPGLPVEDWEDTLVAPGAIAGCPAPFDASTSNACFAPGAVLPGLAVQDNPLNDTGGGSPDGLVALGVGFAGSASDQVAANTFIDSFELLFDPPVTAVGGELVHYLGASQTINITIFDENDVQIGSTTGTGTSGAGTFWGVFSDVPIGRINMLSIAPAGDGAEGMDNVTFGTPGGCSAPEDLPWLGLTQSSGSTPEGSSSSVAVTFFAGALPVGVYDGVLCLDSNDPDTPRIEVPVTLTVDTLPFLDGFETGDTSRWSTTVAN